MAAVNNSSAHTTAQADHATASRPRRVEVTHRIESALQIHLRDSSHRASDLDYRLLTWLAALVAACVVLAAFVWWQILT